MNTNNKWIDVNEIHKDIFLIKEVFYKEHANLYFIKGDNCNLLIDTGTGLIDIKRIIKKISKNKTIVVNTHSHYDHIGCNYIFDIVKIHKLGVKNLRNPSNEDTLINLFNKNDLITEPRDFVEYKVLPTRKIEFLKNGDVINLGNFSFKIVFTPGHSNDSVCLLDENNEIIFCGDTVYDGSIYYLKNIEQYKNSLKKLLKLKIKTAFPGHNKILNYSKYIITIRKILNDLKYSKKVNKFYMLNIKRENRPGTN